MGYAFWNAQGTVVSREDKTYSNGEFVTLLLAVGNDQYPDELEVACFGNRAEVAKTVNQGDTVMVSGRLSSPENDRGYRNVRLSVGSLVVVKAGDPAQAQLQQPATAQAPAPQYAQPQAAVPQPQYAQPQAAAPQPQYAQPSVAAQSPAQQVHQAAPQTTPPGEDAYDEDIPF